VQPPIRQGDIPGVQLRHAGRFELGPEALWAWLTEADKLGRWLAASVEPRAGDEPGWLLRDVDEAGVALVEDVLTIAADEGKLWVALLERRDDGWESATRVTLRIEGDGPCELSVLQQGFERLNLSRCLTIWELYRRRWRRSFARLRDAVHPPAATRG
jgi:hypothetical protein